MSLCFPPNEYRRGLFCTPIPSLVRSFRSISESLIQYLYIFDSVYHFIFHLNCFELYFIIFLIKFSKSFDIQGLKLKGSRRVREKKEKRREERKHWIVFRSKCCSVESRVVSFQFESYNEKRFFIQGDEGDELIDERIIRYSTRLP